MGSLKIAASAAAFMLLALATHVTARTCPDCEAKYEQCEWNCYQNGGWQPVCALLVDAKQAAMGNPPDPTNTQLFSSACGAQCYLKFMGSYMSLSNVKVLYNQNTPGSCENTWKTNAALDYQLYEQNPITANVLNSPPAWLNQAVGNLSENIDQNQVNNDYETCMVCDASQQTTSSPSPKPPAVVQPDTSPSPSPTTSPSPSPSPSDLENFPVVYASPSPSPALLIPVETLVPVPAPLPAVVAPTPEISILPLALPPMPSPSPPPPSPEPVVLPTAVPTPPSAASRGVLQGAVAAAAVLLVNAVLF